MKRPLPDGTTHLLFTGLERVRLLRLWRQAAGVGGPRRAGRHLLALP